MMTATATRTAAFTITDARYVGAKIGADLRLLNDFYGHPALASIDNFAEEAALLLRDGYLRNVDYGFRDETSNAWKLRLRYTATAGGPTVLGAAGKPFRSATWCAAVTVVLARCAGDLARVRRLGRPGSRPRSAASCLAGTRPGRACGSCALFMQPQRILRG